MVKPGKKPERLHVPCVHFRPNGSERRTSLRAYLAANPVLAAYVTRRPAVGCLGEVSDHRGFLKVAFGDPVSVLKGKET